MHAAPMAPARGPAGARSATGPLPDRGDISHVQRGVRGPRRRGYSSRPLKAKGDDMSVLRRGEPRASPRSRRASILAGGDREMAGTVTQTHPAETARVPKKADGSSREALDANIIIANAPDPVFVSDLEGRILQANEAVSELLGFRDDELLEQSLSRFISPEERREFTAALREVVERGVTRNAMLHPRSASGEVIPTSLNASALRDAEGRVIGAIGILRDMRELDKARAYAESLIKNAPDPVFVSDLEGRILQANDAVSQLLGFRPDELLEQSLSRFISPEETREFVAALREVVEHGVSRNVRLHPRSASGEVISTTLNASALRDADGNVIGAIGILRDMRAYEQVLHDLEDSRRELRDADQAKDRFLAIVSHELRTPLTAMLGWVRLLTTGRLDDATSARALPVIERNTKLLAQLLDDLLDVSGIIAGKLR